LFAAGVATWTFHRTDFGKKRLKLTIPVGIGFAVVALGLFFIARYFDRHTVQAKVDTGPALSSQTSTQSTSPQSSPPQTTPQTTKEKKKKTVPLRPPTESPQPSYSVTNPTDSIVNQNSPNYGDQRIIHNPPVNPNKPVTTYDFNGIRRTVSSNGQHVEVNDLEFQTFATMRADINAHDWNALVNVAENTKKRAPEWLTPYFGAGEAYAFLCDKEQAVTNLKFFVDQGKGSPTYEGAVSDSEKILGILQADKFPADCASGSPR
jgi:hypothetical protein